MAKNRITIKKLSKETELDVEDIILRLWEGGLGYLEENYELVGSNLRQARRILGLPTRRELTSIAYWQKRFSLNSDDFFDFMKERGISISPSKKQLPPNLINRLKTEAKQYESNQIGLTERLYDQPDVVIQEKFKFEVCGHSYNQQDIRWIKTEEVLKIHDELVNDFTNRKDPISPPGVKSIDLLESACFHPKTSLNGIYKYCTIESVAAALLYALVHNHPFHNGNKRTALVSMLAFLDKNGITLQCSDDELFDFVLEVAKHRLVSFGDRYKSDREICKITEWIVKESRVVERGDRPIEWRKLRKILSGYDCNFDLKTGNRMDIYRVIPRTKRRFGFSSKAETLYTQVAYRNEGSEVTRDTIKKIRKELKLNYEHGIDAKEFYSGSQNDPAYFITRYRKILVRLSRL